MSAEDAALAGATRAAAIRAGGRWLRLPAGAEAVAEPLLRPVPGAPAPLRGIALVAGRAVPAFALAEARAWAVAPMPGGPVLLGGEALAEAVPEGADPLPPLTDLAWPAPPLPHAVAPEPRPAPQPVATPGLALIAGALRLVLPLSVVERVGLAPGPVGVPVFDLGGAAALVVLLRLDGRRLGIACARVEPAPADGDGLALLRRRIGGQALPAAEDLPTALPEPARPVLVCTAGTGAGAIRFALPAESVIAAIAPRRPDPPPPGALPAIRGLVAHRAAVLPVVDAAECLGLGRREALAPAPLVRLAGAAPVALRVEALHGLQPAAELPLHRPEALLARLLA